MPRHKEYLVVAETRSRALRKLESTFSKYIKQRSISAWAWRVAPEADFYRGASKKLAGKWRAYARISFDI